MYLVKLFRRYDKERKGTVAKEDVFEITKELHSLCNGSDTKMDIDMTVLQFEQVFKLLDQDGSGAMEPKEMVGLFQAYETWLYEKQYKSAMEELYSDHHHTGSSSDGASEG